MGTPDAYKDSLALLTDFYQFTMAYGYWRVGMHDQEAVFHLTFRRKPFKGGYVIAAGLEAVVSFLKNFHFDTADLDYLASLKGEDHQPIFPREFLDYLAQLHFTVEVDAVPEGSIVFPYEPIIRVKGPLLQCQLLETPFLNLINFPTLIATKAARVCQAAKGDSVLEFGLRRAQGIDGGLTASRAAFIGGCSSTSNVLAGKMFGIPVRGTHAHSWVMAFDNERASFETYAQVMPSNCILLVDTYDTLEGIQTAIEVGKKLREQGQELFGVRLDSGDLSYLSKASRKMLDAAGFPDVQILASGDLDELSIEEAKQKGAQVAIWGVGTALVTGKGQPALDGIYKLAALKNRAGKWTYKLKLSENLTKPSDPGILQCRRYFDQEGRAIADMLYDVETNLPAETTLIPSDNPTKATTFAPSVAHEDLLVPIFRNGQCVYTCPPLGEIQQRAQRQLKAFSAQVKRLVDPEEYLVGMEKSLYHLKMSLLQHALRTH